MKVILTLGNEWLFTYHLFLLTAHHLMAKLPFKMQAVVYAVLGFANLSFTAFFSSRSVNVETFLVFLETSLSEHEAQLLEKLS